MSRLYSYDVAPHQHCDQGDCKQPPDQHNTQGENATGHQSRGQHCGDIELAGYLANAAGPVPLVLDLRIAHDCFGSSSDPSFNGNLHYPNNIDRSLNEAADDKIRKYRADYNNSPPKRRILRTLVKIIRDHS